MEIWAGILGNVTNCVYLFSQDHKCNVSDYDGPPVANMPPGAENTLVAT